MKPKATSKRPAHQVARDMVLLMEKRKSIQCSVIAITLIIKEIDDNFDSLLASELKKYWSEVITELDNLQYQKNRQEEK